jgi:hypothetical protein
MDHDNLGETVRSFVSHYANGSIQSSLPLMVEDDPRQLTPVLVEAALCFDERVGPLYDLWSEDVLQELIDRLDDLDDSPGNPLTSVEWKVLHVEIESSILTGLNDAQDLQEMLQWLSRDPSVYGVVLRGALSFLQGEPERTIELYEEALRRLRKEAGKRSVVIPGLPALFFAFALIQTEPRQEHLARLIQLADQTLSLFARDRFTLVLQMLADFARVARGDLRFEQCPWLVHEPVTAHPWLDLFRGVALYWLDMRPGDKQIRRLNRHVDKAINTDQYWYANEGTALLKMLGVDTDEIDYRNEDNPQERLVSLYQAKPRWEENLAALNLITQHYGDEGKESRDQVMSDRRMVWWIHGEGSFVTLEPREQRRNKKGAWSKGRKVALKRLKEELQSFDFLTSADLRICAAIDERYERNYSYYVETSYGLEGEQALRAAMGHPYLYRGDMDGRDSQTVTLEAVSPRLEVVEDKREKTIRIQMHPYPDRGFDFMRDFLCYWAERHCLQTIKFNEGQIEIARILTSQGLVAPLSAKEQILSSITMMAPLVTIHSDIGGGAAGDAEEIPADKTPCVHLHPIKQSGESGIEMGLHLSLHYSPLGEKGPSFQPGEGRAALFVEIEGQPRKAMRDLNAEVVQATQLVDRLQLPAAEDPWRWTLDDPEQALEVLLALQGTASCGSTKGR